MPTITIESELYKRVEEAAQADQASVDEILAEALRQYFWEDNRRKISEETSHYRSQYSTLKAQYHGQYIAMHKGQVIDHDADFMALHQRVRQRFGRTAVMITRVDDVVEPAITRRGFRMEASY